MSLQPWSGPHIAGDAGVAESMDEIMNNLPDGEIANLSYLLLQMELKGIVIENELHAFRRAERE